MANKGKEMRIQGRRWDRRRFLTATSLAAGLTAACSKEKPSVEKELPSDLGAKLSGYGERSKFDTAKRLVPELKRPEIGSSTTPLAESEGIITPAPLHFERHHAGVPQIDPATHTLLIHGLVDRPTVYTIDELKRLPSESHIYFV